MPEKKNEGESATLREIADYQARLKQGCTLTLRRSGGQWLASVSFGSTGGYADRRAPTLDDAWARLRTFLDERGLRLSEHSPEAADFMMTPEESRTEWLAWARARLNLEVFYDVFLKNAQGAKSRCVHCRAAIYLDIVAGGGVTDWRTAYGDYGCDSSPETTEEGVGSHMPVKS